MLLRIMSFSVAVAVLAALPGGDAVAKKDLDAMQGLWKVAELTEKGEKLADKDLAAVTVVIQGDRMTLSDDGKLREEIMLKLNASQKTKTVDFFYTKGPNIGKLERGIYTMDGDRLWFCMNETKGGARPTEFVSTKTNGCSMAMLKRVKK